MEEIVLVCGQWKIEKKRWNFTVDENRGCRLLYADSETRFEDFIRMVFEDFDLDEGSCEVRLSYRLARKALQKIPVDTPPVYVTNGRQFQGYLRQCKVEPVRLCVQIEGLSEKPFVDRGDLHRTQDFNAGDEGVPQSEKKDAEYYSRKRAGKKRVDDQEIEAGDEEIDADDEEIDADDDEQYRFDYCDDSDGASSGDEDYCLYSKYSKNEEEVTFEEYDAEAEKEHGRCRKQEDLCLVDNNSGAGKELIKTEMGAVDLAVGQRFESREALERRLKILSVHQKFDFDVDRSVPNLYVVRCWVQGCKWRVRASTIGDSPVLHIRIYVREHTCSVTERSARNRQATPDILGELYKDYVGSVAGSVLPSHVAHAMNLRYGIKIDYWKAHRTLLVARKLVRGTPEEGYAELPSYLYMLRRANPGTHTKLEVDDQHRFKYVFIAFGASIHGFQFMRKVVVVDGTFLKGPYKGTLLLATTQDGNFNIFPLAYAVVDTENDESWDWFFRQLSCVIPDDEGLAIISDRHKSIGKAIGKVYPLASRGICTYHLYKNILLKFRGSETFRLVKQAASAYRVVDFNDKFQQIEALNPLLHRYLERADVRMWSRAHFPGDRYNFTTSNIAESINKVINPARNYPIVQLLDTVRLLLTRWFAARRKQAADMPTILTAGVENMLEGRVEKAKTLDVQEIDAHQFQVTGVTSTHVVNLTLKKCSCRRYELEKIPCIHAIASAEKAQKSRIGQCHSYYRTDYLRKGYEKLVMPKDGSLPVPNHVATYECKPPFIRNPPGRPKMSRMKSFIEVALERKRPRKLHACSKCKNVGHNRTTCPA